MFTVQDQDGIETFSDEEAVLTALKHTASAEYSDKVVKWMTTMIPQLEINNGPNNVEIWTRSK